jgi:hypothetical protein
MILLTILVKSSLPRCEVITRCLGWDFISSTKRESGVYPLPFLMSVGLSPATAKKTESMCDLSSLYMQHPGDKTDL